MRGIQRDFDPLNCVIYFNKLFRESEMIIRIALLVFLMSLILVPASEAREGSCIRTTAGKVVCASPDGYCKQSISGTVYCSTPGGNVIQDNLGNVYCGPGDCVDAFGTIYCSSKPYGGAILDGSRKAVCAGDCVQASVSYCEKVE
jgi:hypothetical protein